MSNVLGIKIFFVAIFFNSSLKNNPERLLGKTKAISLKFKLLSELLTMFS